MIVSFDVIFCGKFAQNLQTFLFLSFAAVVLILYGNSKIGAHMCGKVFYMFKASTVVANIKIILIIHIFYHTHALRSELSSNISTKLKAILTDKKKYDNNNSTGLTGVQNSYYAH